MTTEENKTLTAAPEDASASPLPVIEEAESAKTAEAKSAEPKAAEPSEPKPVEPKPAEPKPPAAKDEDSASKRISILEGKLAAREAGVPKEYTEDVLTLARAEMKKNGSSLEEAIGAVLKRHPSFKGTPPASITTGAAVKNDVPDNTDDAEVKMIMGIK